MRETWKRRDAEAKGGGPRRRGKLGAVGRLGSRKHGVKMGTASPRDVRGGASPERDRCDPTLTGWELPGEGTNLPKIR